MATSGDQKIVIAANKEVTQKLIFCGKYNKAKIISKLIPCLIGPDDGGKAPDSNRVLMRVVTRLNSPVNKLSLNIFLQAK